MKKDISILLIKILFVVYILSTVFQNVISMAFADKSYLVSLIILGFKDACLYLFLVLWFLSFFYRLKTDFFSALSIGIIIYLMLISAISFDISIMSLRQLLIIPLSVVMGRVLYLYNIQFGFLFKTVIFSCLFVVITGYYELFLLYDQNESFWNYVGMPDWMGVKGFDKWSDPDLNVSRSFYSYDFYSALDNRVRRMVSILAEPTIFGQLMPLPAFYFYLRRNYLLSLFFTAAILFSLSKGGLVVLFLAVLIKHYLTSDRIVRFAMVVSALFIAGLLLYVFTFAITVQSVNNHFAGAIGSIDILLSNPLGLGVGQSGNYYNLSVQYSDTKPGESYIGMVLSQFGLIGLVLILYYISKVTPFRRLLSINTARSSILIVVAATWITAIFSESAITYTGTAALIAISTYIAYETKSGKMCL